MECLILRTQSFHFLAHTFLSFPSEAVVCHKRMHNLRTQYLLCSFDLAIKAIPYVTYIAFIDIMLFPIVTFPTVRFLATDVIITLPIMDTIGTLSLVAAIANIYTASTAAMSTLSTSNSTCIEIIVRTAYTPYLYQSLNFILLNHLIL